ncbi:ABC transporter ATP-binding protein [Pseudonocardia thermophila]|uniref:ABC transporter ATP-binding protein n=1 Tax=Pseudonocardia thermophila TaxID=1848 RepID=UPI000937DB05|nr:ABC transporter ATP-binding protein [Pseudonocardia thermophila]
MKPGNGAAVTARGLRMQYGSREVLRGVDLDVGRGEIVALLGPNGAGKTTTIEILEGFRKRSSGTVTVLGTDPDHGDEAWRARLGIVLQSWRDHSAWRVRELLGHLGSFYAPYGSAARPRPCAVDDLLAVVGLADVADRRIGTLSGGQRRRLDVAVGLVGRPDLLFLDEPTTGFDPQARLEFHELVRTTVAGEDTAVLLTTHDLAEAEKLADRIVVLAGGRIVADGTATELAAQVVGDGEVRWCRGGAEHRARVSDPTAFVRELFARERRDGMRITDLTVRVPTLEESYLALVERAEQEAGTGTEMGTGTEAEAVPA